MNSLKEVFGAMTAHDHEKVAQVRAAQGLPAQQDLSHADPDLIKQAQDYDTIGRTLAHHVFADMVKQAVDESMPNASPEEKKQTFEEAMAEALGEKKKEGEKKEGEGEGEEKAEGEAEKTSAAKVKAKKKKILAKMAQDPQYVARLVAKYQGR